MRLRLKLNAIRVMAAVLATATAALVGGAVLAPFRADGKGAAGNGTMTISDNSAYRVSEEDLLLAYDGGVDRVQGKVFNLEVLDALAQGLGYTNVKAAIDDIKNGPDPTENTGDGQGKGGIRTSKDFREAVDKKDPVRNNKNVAVKVGGKVWDAVSLTKDVKNNVILTLWESAADNLTRSHFAPFRSTKSLKESQYPSNMYSTSVLRVHALNAGGQYATSDSTLSTPLLQNPQSPYAIFTMEGVDCSITRYIVTPSQVAYQETESTQDTWLFGSKEGDEVKKITNNFPNSAYGKETRGNWNGKDNSWGIDYAAKDGYEAWKDDLLWLPSLVETGNDRNGAGAGLWETDGYLRSAPQGWEAWTRSGHDTNLTKVYALKYASGSTAHDVNLSIHESNGASAKMCVRPAFHLNLTEAAKDAYMPKPTDETKTEIYDGTEKTLSIPYHAELTYTPEEDSASWWKEDAHTITATNAGTYQVTVALPEGSCWADGTKDSVTYTLIISKADIEQHWGEDGKVSQRQSDIYHDATTHPLALPKSSDESFPLSLVDGKDTIEVKYKNATDTVSPDSLESVLTNLNVALETANTSQTDPNLKGVGAKFSDNWGDAPEASAPGVYIVLFKAVDTDGNHNDLYGYFTMRIFSEKLTIKLNVEDLSVTVKYGDTVHTQGPVGQLFLINQIFPHIDSITASTESGDLHEDGKSKFEAEALAGKFKFYFRDSPNRGIGTRYDVGEGVLLNVGTYYLFAEYAEEQDGENSGKQTLITFDWQNSKGESMRPSFTVTPAELHIQSVNPSSASYSGAEHSGIDVILSGLKNGETLTKDTDYTLVFKPQSGSLGGHGLPQGVGTYTVEVILSEESKLAGNYKIVGPAGSYEITVGAGAKPWVEGENTFTYNGQRQTVTVSGFDAGIMNFAVSDGAAFEPENGQFGATNAGVYTLTVTLKEGSGYEWDGGDSVGLTITIERAQLTVKLGGDSDVFDGNEKDVTVIFEDLPPQGAALTEGTDYTVRFDVSDEGSLGANGKPQGVGTYTVTVTLSEESEAAGNYELVGATATFVIANAASAADAGPIFVYLFVQAAVLIVAAIVLTRKKHKSEV